MKIYYPSYYEKFKCIADRCKHSCCVGWEIAVDDATMDKYRAIGDAGILAHIRDGEIIMENGGRCPFLRHDGLCRLIADYGEDCISEICREHPRFYHRVGDRIEMGIGASCEEAARLILSSDYKDFSSRESEIERHSDTDFDSLAHRERIYALLSEENASFTEKIDRISSEYGIENLFLDCDYWNSALGGLELLDEGHRECIFLRHFCENEAKSVFYERFFAYLVFRHLSTSDSEENLRARLGFCILLTKILMSGENSDFDAICRLARVISEEIEYSEDNTDGLIFEIECAIA